MIPSSTQPLLRSSSTEAPEEQPVRSCRCTGLRHERSDACLIYAPHWCWSGDKAKLIPLGLAFSAVRLSLQAAEELLTWSRYVLLGPAFAHHDTAYVLVPTASAKSSWPQGVTFLGRDVWVPAPAPQCTGRGPRGLRWLRTPHEAEPTPYTAAVLLQQLLGVCTETCWQPQPP
ncbi:hypothetical protein [Streptomyces mobaraensis]|uniref:Uncharacterized protein n=1 Tax=Streptomyces mobaraensis TaxID=35621 RepID=A0A5N5W2S3_STRMB|nr:hypothetical protein [Streptomyces mobaraensis]KAB7835517.1 hypothetical protein FRZ00_26880 [Streptomyces mobaraensis]